MSDKYSIPDKYKGYKVWSFSKLNSFKDCPYGYYLQRIRKLKGKQNIWSILGSIVHELLEDLLQDKITKEQAILKFNNELDESEILGIAFPTRDMENNYKKAILHYLERWEKPDIKDFKIELKSFLKLDDKNVLIGFIDFIIKNHDGTVEVIDFKTSSKFTGKDLAEKARQLIIYSEMLKQNYNKIKEVKVAFDMLKYAVTRYKGKKRTKTVERHKLVLLLKDKIESDLLEKYDELEANEILIEAISKNEIPKEVEDNYEITPFIQEYVYNEEEIQELYSWIGRQIEIIDHATEYPAKIDEDEKSEFFCENLCGVSEHCESYQKYLLEKENEEINNEIDDDLF